ncbi:MAG: hypothetical protein V4594_08085 [Bacteroidota bacterium]
MKRLSPIVLVSLLTLLFSCVERDRFSDQAFISAYKPVLMDRESLERSIKWEAPAEIKSPAKIYYKDNYILISERYKGIHVVDNTDPKNPVIKGYISVPGCVDMSIKESILYVDNAVDLVAIDLSKIAAGQIEVKKRIKETFPDLVPPDGVSVPYRYTKGNRPQNSVIVNWVKIKS